MSWNPNAFASIVQAQPLLIFGRPVHLWDSSLDYDPVVLLKPFRLHLTMDALPCPITTGPSEALPPLLDIDPGPRVEWDFNPPETCAARHTLSSAPTPCHPSPQASLPSPSDTASAPASSLPSPEGCFPGRASGRDHRLSHSGFHSAEMTGPPRFLEDPNVCMPCSSTPAEPWHPC